MKLIFTILTLSTLLLSDTIELVSKLYITPAEDENKLSLYDANKICVKAKYGVYTVDISHKEKLEIVKANPCKKHFKELHTIEKDVFDNVEKYGLHNDIIYSKNKKVAFLLRHNRFEIYDMSKNREPVSLNRVTVFKAENHMYVSDILFSKDEKYAYVQHSFGLTIYDIEDLKNIKLLGEIKREGTDELNELGIIDKNYLYIAEVEAVVTIVNIKNKHKPTVKEIETGGMLITSVEKYAKDRLLVLGDDTCCGYCIFMDIIDISNPEKVKIVGKFVKKNEWVYDSLLVDGYVFFLGKNGLSVYGLKR